MQITSVLPMMITGYGATLLMLLVAFVRRHVVTFVSALIILATAFAALFIGQPFRTEAAWVLRVDRFAIYFEGLIIAGAFLIALLCYDYLRSRPEQTSAFYVLLLFAVLGTQAIVCSSHFIAFFLGLEILSVSLYGLVGYARGYKPSLEAAVKYLVLAATASAFLLLGIALIYADTGTMRILTHWTGPDLSTLSYLGLALILVALGFKLAVVPFHMWSPDVYQGAPAPVTALIATGSKAAVLVFLMRLTIALGFRYDGLAISLGILSVASMTVGNLLALMQTNVKRLLAYSSIAHMGYLLVAVIAGGQRGASSVGFYLASYFATTIAAFGVIAVVSSRRAKGDVENLNSYRGLGYQRPALGIVFALAMLSLTGIPPTAGFFAKFYVFSAAADAGLWWLLIVGVINSGISAFYYLRVLVALYQKPEAGTEPLPAARPLSGIALGVASVAMVGLGIYPEPLLRLANLASSLLPLLGQ